MKRLHPRSNRRVAGKWSNPSAYTLQELLIVVTILAAVAAIAWPTVRPLLSRSSQRDAALQLAAELAEARERAIRTGRAQELRVVAGTGCYSLVTPLSLPSSTPLRPARPAADREEPISARSSTDSEWEEVERADRMHRQLAGGVIFAPADPRPDASRTPATVFDAEAFKRVEPDLADDPGGDGMVAAQFYPDGRSTDSVIELTVPGSRETVAIHVRGLTGGLTIRAGDSSAAESDVVSPETPLSDPSRPDGALR